MLYTRTKRTRARKEKKSSERPTIQSDKNHKMCCKPLRRRGMQQKHLTLSLYETSADNPYIHFLLNLKKEKKMAAVFPFSRNI